MQLLSDKLHFSFLYQVLSCPARCCKSFSIYSIYSIRIFLKIQLDGLTDSMFSIVNSLFCDQNTTATTVLIYSYVQCSVSAISLEYLFTELNLRKLVLTYLQKFLNFTSPDIIYGMYLSYLPYHRM